MASRIRSASLIAQSLLYIAGGVNHFAMQKLYVGIMPTHYSHPAAWVRWTGVAEILGGAGLLVPATRRAAAWGLIAMLVAYIDVHLYMLRHTAHFAPIPTWVLAVRIPLQVALIAWAYIYTRRSPIAQ